VLREELVPFLLCPAQVPHMLAWEQNQTSVARAWQLTASDMAQRSPSVILLFKTHLVCKSLGW